MSLRGVSIRLVGSKPQAPVFPGPEHELARRVIQEYLRPGVPNAPERVALVIRDSWAELQGCAPGECKDPDHAGLRRLITNEPPVDVNDLSWMGQDVETLHYLIRRLIQENKDFWNGTVRRSMDTFSVTFAIASACLLVGVTLGFLWFSR